MDGISVIGRVVDQRYLEGQPNPTHAFDLLYFRGVHGWSDLHVVTRETQQIQHASSLAPARHKGSKNFAFERD